MSSVLPATLLALVAAGALVLGSALPTMPVLHDRFFAKRLSLLIGFSAGLMLATSLHELLPEAMEKNPLRAMQGAALGFLALYVAERFTHFHACRHRDCEIDEAADEPPHEHDHQHGPASTLSHATPQNAVGHLHGHLHAPSHGHADTIALVGMSIHNFADGLTTAAAFSVSQTVGVIVVVAIMLHQMAAGLSLGAIMLRAGRNRRRVLFSTMLSASFILWGALFYGLVIPLGESSQGVVLGIAGGSFLYVAACDLLPEAHAADEGWFVTATTLCGYGFVLLLRMLVGSHAH